MRDGRGLGEARGLSIDIGGAGTDERQQRQAADESSHRVSSRIDGAGFDGKYYSPPIVAYMRFIYSPGAIYREFIFGSAFRKIAQSPAAGTEFDSLKNMSGNGRHANFINLVNLSRTFFGNVTIYGELWSDVNDDPLTRTKQLTFDTAVAWLVAPNLQLDIGANLGLSKDAPDFQAYIGIAQRF
jgi:Putative MetA-pathway of phenol degradation